MDHPEKALFEEVKGLKDQMEEVRNRIFKLEATYVDKVENTETREHKAEIINKKFSIYKENLSSMKLFQVDGLTIPLFKTTVTDTIYRSDYFIELFEDSGKEVIIDTDIVIFNAILDIIKKGHNFYCLDEEDKNEIVKKFNFSDKSISKNPSFNQILKKYFPDKETFSKLIVDFDLNYKSIPDDLSNIVQAITNTTNSSNMSHVINYLMKNDEESQLLFNKNNKKALFLDYTKEAIVELKEKIRIKTIGLKPFTDDNNAFSPTTGSYYASLYISEDGKDWDLIGVMPSTYGSPNDDYISKFTLSKYKTIKFFKFRDIVSLNLLRFLPKGLLYSLLLLNLIWWLKEYAINIIKSSGFLDLL